MFSFMRQLVPYQLYPGQPISETSSGLINSDMKKKLVGMMPRVTGRLGKLKEQLMK